MLQKRKFEITRAGNLEFYVSGPNHCGPENYMSGGYIKTRYKVNLVATGSLDEKGFLIDNTFISEFMKREAAAGTTLSCELLLEDLASKLYDEMCDAEPSLQIIDFCMSLSPYFGEGEEATMTYFYDGQYSSTVKA